MKYLSQVTVAIISISLSSSAFAQKVVEVNFPKPGSPAMLKGQLKGREYVDYVVTSKAGQMLKVNLNGSNKAIYLNILPKNSEAALHIGSTNGNSATRMLPDDGKYRIRIYLMPSAGRQGEAAKYSLSVSIAGKALVPVIGDAKLPESDYHATARVKCKLSYDSSITECDAYLVRRSHDGTATVVLKAGNQKRSILFIKGKPSASDSAEKMTYSKKGDVISVSFGVSERYEIVEALIFGG